MHGQGTGIRWGFVYRYAPDRLQGQGHQPFLMWGFGPPTHLPKDLCHLSCPIPCPLLLSSSASSHLKKPSLDITFPPWSNPLLSPENQTEFSTLICTHFSLSLSTHSLSHCFLTSTYLSKEFPLTNVPSDLQDPVSPLH